MKRGILLLAFVIGPAGSAFAHHLALVVHHDNARREVTAAEVAGMLDMRIRDWPDGKHVVLVMHREPEHEVLTLERLGNMSREHAQRLINEHRHEIRFVDSDENVLQTVSTTPGALGLVDFHAVKEGVNVVKVDGKLPMEKGYVLP